MDIISRDILSNLIENCEGWAVSIYMPTYVSGREVKQNPVRLKNLVDQAEEKMLKIGTGQSEVHDYLAPLAELIDNEVFWQEQDEGLALFLDNNELKIYKIPERFDELVIIGKAFHITPLIPIFKGNGPYYLLALDQEHPRIYQGSKFKLSRIEELDLPESLQKMFDEFYEFHSHLQFHNRTATPNPDIKGRRNGMYFGQGGDDIDENAEIRNFFHRFDEALMEYLDGENTPLLLAGLGYLHPIYREVNSYPNLVEEGITKDVDPIQLEELHEISWKIVQERYQTNVEKALNVFHQLDNKDGDTTKDLETIVSAAFCKRVNSVFIAENEHIWGRFDHENNKVEIVDVHSPEVQDLLNFAASQTFINGGNVLVLPKKLIPGNNPAAAILRY